MSWLDQIEEGSRERCAEIKDHFLPRFSRLFGYGEKPSDETLERERKDMIAKALQLGVSEEEAIIIVDEVMRRKR